ncbi:arylsulfatase [Dysgonomonas hofstadii]|uniref:Arylsulfatase n=1 Tax=Dysgonomonas hofstadii TaxID=637886 RepID=A0A840CSB7_9BACT|nr:sulfatase [Dysgonomonas hofstadii]MBB4035805.1 arylsulfatase [Dysgonomonas hofstadii]
MKNKLVLLAISGYSLSVYAQQQVNFVLINLDDCGYGDFSYKGAMGYTTPNIDKMAAEGMQFSHFLAAQPVSGASRAALLTGCYPNRIGFSGAPGPSAKTGINADEETIAEVLKKKNYATAAYGKWHLGHLEPFLPLQNGFDEYYGIPYSNDMWPNHPQQKFPDLPTIEGNKVIGYNTDQSQFTTDFTNRAVNFITKNKNNPFFVYLAHPMPHVPLAVSGKFKGKSEQGMYGDVLMEIDWSVGQILKTLKELNLEENTLIILTSDNGPWINYGNHAGSTGGLREGKGTTFDGGNRVPCIIYWKGKVEAGTVCNTMAINMDILPTFADISGADLPKNKIDGVSILPLLKGEKFKPHEFFYYYYRKNDLEAVTDGTFKLILPHKHRTYTLYPSGNDGQPGKVEEFFELKDYELYDLRRDPGERYNVIGQYPVIADMLMKAANVAREDLGDNITKTEGANCRPIGTIKAD